MSEYDHEPVRGLPGLLPPGEHMLWQGAPDWRQLAAGALHIRLATGYFAIVALGALISGDLSTAAAVALLGAVAIGLFVLFAWGVARTTVYTLTDRRIVLRIGVALNTCVNLPLTEIASADLKMLGQGHGSLVLKLKGTPRLGYLMLWPHARSLRVISPQPMLRAVPDALAVSRLLYQAVARLQAIAPAAAADHGPTPARQPVRELAGAAA